MPASKERLPTYQRAAHPPGFRVTARDGRILEAIHAFDGLLADYQIKRLFFSGASQLRLRMRLLYHHGYVARPDRRRRASLPAMVYWLDRRGAAYVAGLSGQSLGGFRYRARLKQSGVEHDLAVNDFRLDVMEACARAPDLELEEWVPQGEFWAHPDRVEYRDAQGRWARRKVRPDGTFVVRQWQAAAGEWRRYRFLLELDRATEDNPRFAREKVRPGVAYLRSEAYRQRFGAAAGRWLVVTTGERRLANMKRQAELAVGREAALFAFTTARQVTPETLFAAPIWHRGGEAQPRPLLG